MKQMSNIQLISGKVGKNDRDDLIRFSLSVYISSKRSNGSIWLLNGKG